MYVAQRPYHNEEGSWVKVCQNAVLVLTSPGPIGERKWGITVVIQWDFKRQTNGSGPKFELTQHLYLYSIGLGWEMMSWQCVSSVFTALCVYMCVHACVRVGCVFACACVCERLGRRRGLSKAGMQGYITMRSWELWAVCIEGRRDVNER